MNNPSDITYVDRLRLDFVEKKLKQAKNCIIFAYILIAAGLFFTTSSILTVHRLSQLTYTEVQAEVVSRPHKIGGKYRSATYRTEIKYEINNTEYRTNISTFSHPEINNNLTTIHVSTDNPQTVKESQFDLNIQGACVGIIVIIGGALLMVESIIRKRKYIEEKEDLF